MRGSLPTKPLDRLRFTIDRLRASQSMTSTRTESMLAALFFGFDFLLSLSKLSDQFRLTFWRHSSRPDAFSSRARVIPPCHPCSAPPHPVHLHWCPLASSHPLL